MLEIWSPALSSLLAVMTELICSMEVSAWVVGFFFFLLRWNEEIFETVNWEIMFLLVFVQAGTDEPPFPALTHPD